MKNISLLVVPHFHGKFIEDPDGFLFGLDILYWYYDYTSSERKLKLFLSTLKNSSLCWFMSLGVETVWTWDQMKQLFLGKYQEYYRTKGKREELFKIVKNDYESLEYFV